jgi:hypothetical protein
MSNQTKPSRTGQTKSILNKTKANQTNPTQTKPNQTKSNQTLRKWPYIIKENEPTTETNPEQID